MLKKWKPVLFLIILAVSGVLGFLFHLWAAGPELEASTNDSALTIGLYVDSTTGMYHKPTVALSSDGGTFVTVTISLPSADVTGTTVPLIVVASSSDSSHALKETTSNPMIFAQQLNFSIPTSGPVSSDFLVNSANQTLEYQLSFEASKDSWQSDDGSFASNFPRFDNTGSLNVNFRIPQIQVLGSGASSIICPDNFAGTESNEAVAACSVSQPSERFIPATNVVSTTSMTGLASFLNGYRVDSESPQYSVVDGDYEWSGTSVLAPYLEATKLGSAESRSRDDFLSGISFATAAAALIAFLQEGDEDSKWWRPSRWRRKQISDPSNQPVVKNEIPLPPDDPSEANLPGTFVPAPLAPPLASHVQPSQFGQGMVVGFSMAAALSLIRRLLRR